jgi:hypothetical protein
MSIRPLSLSRKENAMPTNKKVSVHPNLAEENEYLHKLDSSTPPVSTGFTHSESEWGLWKPEAGFKNTNPPNDVVKYQLNVLLLLSGFSKKAYDVSLEVLDAFAKFPEAFAEGNTFTLESSKCDKNAVLSLKVRKVIPALHLVKIATNVKNLWESRLEFPPTVIYESPTNKSQSRKQGKNRTEGLVS